MADGGHLRFAYLSSTQRLRLSLVVVGKLLMVFLRLGTRDQRFEFLLRKRGFAPRRDRGSQNQEEQGQKDDDCQGDRKIARSVHGSVDVSALIGM